MDLGTSYNRLGSGLRTIGQQLISQLVRSSSSSRTPSSAQHNDTLTTEPAYRYQQQQQQISPTNPLPLDVIPGDVCLNILSFLPAVELCAVRGTCWGLLQTADEHSDVLWEHLCRWDFPSVSPAHEELFSPHQQYIKNVISRATEEAGNLNATRHIRECFQSYSSKFGYGVIGFVSDLCTIPNPRIARAVSHKRLAAMTTAVVANEDVIYDFRRSGLYKGPLNFLPLRTLQLAHPLSGMFVPVGHEDRDESALLPSAPETPPPPGFLGYAVRLMQLRPEHELLRWTVMFTLFKDLAVFETTEQAEAVRARTPDGALFYCALDYPGAQDDPCPGGGSRWSLPHIGHWGFRPPLVGGKGEGVQQLTGASRGDGGGGGAEMVGLAVDRLERTACFARSSLAFLQYGGGVGGRL